MHIEPRRKVAEKDNSDAVTLLIGQSNLGALSIGQALQKLPMASGDLQVFVKYLLRQDIFFAALTLPQLFAFHGHSSHPQLCVPFLFKSIRSAF